MKDLFRYITEKFIINQNSKKSDVDPKDPTHWQVGEILAGTWRHNNIYPVFYKIVKKTNATFTLAQLEGKLISGSFNSRWTEEPDITKLGKEIRVKINKNNMVVVNNVVLGIWDGQPLAGNNIY